MTIIDAIHDPKIFKRQFKDIGTWRAWEIYLRALFRLPIEEKQDKRLFRECTGLTKASKERIRESYVIAGRRSGKSFISAIIAVYLAAFRDWSKYLSPGEKGWVFIIAVDKAQAGIIKSYISGIFRGNKSLTSMIVQETREGIELKNNVSICVKTASFRSIRGYTVLCAILEEIAFWRSEESANPDREILTAIRPALATVPESLLVGISTPYSRQGVLWEQFKEHWGKAGGPLIWRAKTETMNPTIDRRVIASALKEDPAAGRAEWEAEWREDISQFIPVELVESAVIPGRFELPKIEGASYFAHCDSSSGRQDSATLAICHKDDKTGRVILDVLRERRPPFQPEGVITEFSDTLKNYGISIVSADRYAVGYVCEAFAKNGITVRNSDLSASEIYLGFLPLLTNGTVELLDNKRLKTQLSGLERKARSGGKDAVDHYPGGHDDLSVAAAGACIAAGGQGVQPYIWFPKLPPGEEGESIRTVQDLFPNVNFLTDYGRRKL